MSEVELVVDYPSNLFFQLKPQLYLLSLSTPIPKGRYAVVPHIPVLSLDIPLEVYEVLSVQKHVGFLFKTTLPTEHLSNGLLVYSGSWRHFSKELNLSMDEFFLIFKSPHFYLHSATNKCTLVSTPHIATSISNVLTAV